MIRVDVPSTEVDVSTLGSWRTRPGRAGGHAEGTQHWVRLGKRLSACGSVPHGGKNWHDPSPTAPVCPRCLRACQDDVTAAEVAAASTTTHPDMDPAPSEEIAGAGKELS